MGCGIQAGSYLCQGVAVNLLYNSTTGANGYWSSFNHSDANSVNIRSTYIELGNSNNKDNINSSIDGFNTGLGVLGLAQGQLQFAYESMVVSETSATYSNISRINSLRALGRSAVVLNGLQTLGKVANYAGVGIVLGKLLYNEEVKPSDILDGIIGGATFIPGWGWGVAGLYLISDVVTKFITGQSIDNILIILMEIRQLYLGNKNIKLKKC